MKSTIILDTDDFIIGFGCPVIDPIETQEIVKELILDDADFKQIKVLDTDFRAESQKSIEKRRSVQHSMMLKKQVDADKYYKEFLDHQVEITKIMDKIKPLVKKVDDTKKKLIRQDAVYMVPKQGEEIIEDDEIAVELKDKFKELPPGKRLKKDGSEVFDYRGFVGYKKVNSEWTEVTINQIGVDIGVAKPLNQLTQAEQIEVATYLESTRISNLSASAKLAEKNVVITYAVSAAATMRSELEIQGESAEDALTQATTWYDAEVVIIEAKYA